MRSSAALSKRRSALRGEKHLQEGVHVAALDLELLRHGDADDFPAIDVREVEGVLARAENLCYVAGDEWLEIVGNGLLDTADLLRWLREEAAGEVSGEFLAVGRLLATGEVGQRLLEVVRNEE